MKRSRDEEIKRSKEGSRGNVNGSRKAKAKDKTEDTKHVEKREFDLRIVKSVFESVKVLIDLREKGAGDHGEKGPSSRTLEKGCDRDDGETGVEEEMKECHKATCKPH